MRVLVATASKHGATTDVGAAIADVLRERGHDVVHADAADLVADAGALETAGAVVLGSAVYTGQWLAAATTLRSRLLRMPDGPPVFPFSVGIRDVTLAPLDAAWLRPLRAGAPMHPPVVFGGRLRLEELSLRERSLVAIVRAREGEYTLWDDVREWAERIAARLAVDAEDADRR
ncbi:flavodoxin [Beutenbergia cavernae DSM 12333]|uniref:Flavodoxin n=1 Tax=Beutenbergia cavernae (strain ATCC BAA-8 / DSM 12333 / CCUG 43141 / JCM 11478 / NBRC 16432 / NCIMB 13614 / HKI 0122) TaxID=471853 RepID=C5BW24_BEUC1|nr:flavodoxin domain-containing protein [Beutenbergia cavernae]ACQ80625.1 flavodoxin [Beutenbergia cavernae DSM 12333]